MEKYVNDSKLNELMINPEKVYDIIADYIKECLIVVELIKRDDTKHGVKKLRGSLFSKVDDIEALYNCIHKGEYDIENDVDDVIKCVLYQYTYMMVLENIVKANVFGNIDLSSAEVYLKHGFKEYQRLFNLAISRYAEYDKTSFILLAMFGVSNTRALLINVCKTTMDFIDGDLTKNYDKFIKAVEDFKDGGQCVCDNSNQCDDCDSLVS